VTFKPRLWYPIAAALSALNVAAAGFAATTAEGVHASVHAALGVAFALWAMHLRGRRDGATDAAGLEELGDELSGMKSAMAELEERLDFVERVLAQGEDPQQIAPERRDAE
jgi:hypothetical protein